jgi:hypothetical protein
MLTAETRKRGSMRRVLSVLTLLTLVAAVGMRATAQVARPVAVTAPAALHRDGDAVSARSPLVWTYSAQGHRGIWNWVAIGALGGAVIGGALMAVEVSRMDDIFFPGLVIAEGVGVGALGGGLIGAWAYAASRESAAH